jgi:drug/metabolite transporter (DMT)-like permease
MLTGSRLIQDRRTVFIYLKLVAAAAIWGGTFIAGRIVSTQMDSVTGALGRYLVACLGIVAVASWLEGGLPKLNRGQVRGTAILGLTGVFLYNILFFAALEILPAGRTSLFVPFNPVMVLIGAVIVFRERLTPIRWFGVVLAFIGLSIVVSRGDIFALFRSGIGRGELMMFGAVFAWAAYTLVGRVILKGLTPIAATAYASLWGTLFIALWWALHLNSMPPLKWSGSAVLCMLYLGLFGTVIAFVWFYEGVKAVGAGRAAVFNNLVPVFGVLFAALILGEPVLKSMYVGGAIAIFGVFLTTVNSQQAN